MNDKILESRRKILLGAGVAIGTSAVAGKSSRSYAQAFNDSIAVFDYQQLESLDSSQLVDGQKITVTKEGINGDFLVRTTIMPITSDNATLVQFLDNPNRYAERIFNGAVDVQWFGACGTGSVDDRDALQNAISSHSDIYLPEGEYMISSPIIITATEGKRIRGAGQNATRIVNHNQLGQDAIRLVGTSSTVGARVAYVEISNMTIQGNALSGHGIFTDYSYENTFKRLRILDHSGSGKDGIYIKRGFYSEIIRVTVQGSGNDGIHLGETANGNIISNCHLGGSPEEGNGRAGVYIGSDGVTTQRTHGCQVIGNVFESNKQYNILILDADTCLVSGNYIEGALSDNMTSQVAITAEANHISDGNIIRDNDFTGQVLSIQINNASDTLVSGNDINYGITLYDGAIRTKIVHNTNIDTSENAQLNDGGINTTLFHYDRLQLPHLTNIKPAQGKGQLWFDPNDNNRVKYEP